MSTVAPELLDVDFELELPCEVYGHDHPAEVLVLVTCPRGRGSSTHGMCRWAWVMLAFGSVRCKVAGRCGWGGPRDELMTIV